MYTYLIEAAGSCWNVGKEIDDAMHDLIDAQRYDRHARLWRTDVLTGTRELVKGSDIRALL